MNTRKLKPGELIEEKSCIQTDINRVSRLSNGTSEVALQKKRRSESENGYQLSEDEKTKLINELEFQNEELAAARYAAQNALEKYAELYDFAPLGYFTLSNEGTICELNLSGSNMLGKARAQLKNNRFNFFVSEETRPVFNSFLDQVFKSHSKETCEVILSADDKLPIYIQLTGIISAKEDHCLVTAVDITEQMQAAEIIQARDSFLKDCHMIARLGIYSIDITQGRWKSSEVLDLILGIDPDFDKSFAGWVSIIHPEWQLIITDYFYHEIQANKTKFDKEYKIIRHNDKVECWVHSIGRIEYNDKNQPISIVGAITDITERMQVEIALRVSEARLNKTQSIAHLGSWELDIQTGKLVWSDEVYRIFGLLPNEFASTYESFFESVHPDDRDSLNAAYINSVLENIEGFKIEHRVIRKHTGEVRYVYEKCEHLRDATGKIFRSVGMVQDITERKCAEEIIKLKNEELQKINAEKDKYFSIIAHDLRSPFSGFLGMTELMAKGLPDMTLAEIQEIVLLMRNSATNLFRLLGNLLEWSRMQRGYTTFVPTSFLLMPKISETMACIMEAANQKKITINYTIPKDLVVFADGNMVDAIIRNLVSNAVKFTPKGGSLTVAAKSALANMIEISVSDSGIGMNKHLISNIFRLDINTNRKGTEGEYSTGLGLTICKDFIEKHGGKLWIESEEKKGSTFTFTLPAKPYSEFNI